MFFPLAALEGKRTFTPKWSELSHVLFQLKSIPVTLGGGWLVMVMVCVCAVESISKSYFQDV